MDRQLIPEHFEVAVRAWAVPEHARYKPRERRDEWVDLGPSGWTLIFDTETKTDASQRVRIATYHLLRGGRLREAGIAFDPDVVAADEVSAIHAFAQRRGLRVLTIRGFTEEVLLRVAWTRRGLVIGFNLPYDLSRLAISHSPARSRDASLRGGFSFRLSRNERWPRLQVKRVNARAAFIRFATPKGRHPERRNRERGGGVPDHRGYFLDVGTLAAALLGQKLSLAGLAKILGTDHGKGEAPHGEAITDAYLRYAMDDVQVTWECFEKLRDRYGALGLTRTPIHRVMSEASVGKAHLKEMGLAPWRRLQPHVPDPVTATILESYYGGRAETRIRRVAVPGVLVDFKAQYPTVFVLQGLWRYLIAAGIAWEDEDPARVQAFLERSTLEDVLRPELWTELHRLCLVEPDGDLLPTRAPYAGEATGGGTWNVGISLRTGGPARWWTLADCLASKLGTGRAPRILKVLRFTPRGRQRGLRPIELGGDPRFRVHPSEDDLVRRLVELRQTVKADVGAARRAGEEVAARSLDALQLGMKIAANSVSYGVPIEMNVVEHRKPVGVEVVRSDGSSYRTKVSRTERPGTWFHPLVATLVSGGGRLLLAALMATVQEDGGVWAMCDTDSLFIVARPGGGPVECRGGQDRKPSGAKAVPALLLSQVERLTERFGALNPFDPQVVRGSILGVEEENRDPETGQLRAVECLSIGAKRYGMFTRDAHDRPRIARTSDGPRCSEHGLGHLLGPDKGDPDPSAWKVRWWERVISRALGAPDTEPDWFSDPAVGRLTVTSPREERAFRRYNANRGYPDRIRPWNFLLIAHPHPVERAAGGPTTLVAPYTQDRRERLRTSWSDRRSGDGEPLRIRTGSPEYVIPGTAVVQSYGDYFTEYEVHPEAKAAGPDGEPCQPWTEGLLQPRHIEASRIVRIGKEANRLAENPEVLDDLEDRAVEYPEPSCRACGNPLTGSQRNWCSEACRKRAYRSSPGH